MKKASREAPEIPGLDFVRLLGTGGFSDVFLYEQHLPRRRVAVKVLIADGMNTAAQDAFVGEANQMAQLSAHPYIVTIFHADVTPDDRPYFVMEYCSGPSLSELYKQRVFTTADALRAGVRLSSAVATAHGAGILHRDIKPANVLTNDFGWPALTDFGISSAVEDELPANTTSGRALAGVASNDGLGGAASPGSAGTESQSVGMSVPWSPPEMFGDNPRPDVRSDVFSLAATIHTLLAGRTPFEIPGRSNGALNLIGRIERGAITPINRDDVPATLIGVLNKGMATKRTDRYATAVEFARALQRVELELGYAPTPIEVPTSLLANEPEPDDAADEETRVRVGTPAAMAVTVTPAGPSSQTSHRDIAPALDNPFDATQVRSGTPRSTPAFSVPVVAPAWPPIAEDVAAAEAAEVARRAKEDRAENAAAASKITLSDAARSIRAEQEAQQRALVVRRRVRIIVTIMLVLVALVGGWIAISVGLTGSFPAASGNSVAVAGSPAPGGLR